MALKGDRHIIYSDVSWNMNEVATRGGCASLATAGSGTALDQSQALVTYAGNAGSTLATQSGAKPVGILMGDMVNYDLTKQHINWQRDEVQKGGKVCLMRLGWCVTNMTQPGITIAASQSAYLGPSGLLTNTCVNPVNNPAVGRFDSNADELGYVKLSVDLMGTNFNSLGQ